MKLWNGIKRAASMDWVVEASAANDRSYVRLGWEQAERRLWRRYVAKVALVISLVVLLSFTDQINGIAGAAFGGIGAAWASSGMMRAKAFMLGWLQGRNQMVQNMREHKSPEEWLAAELVYDAVHVSGYARPEVPDSPEGLE